MNSDAVNSDAVNSDAVNSDAVSEPIRTDSAFFARDSLLFVARAWLFSRIFIAVFVYLGHFSHPFLEPIEGGYAGVPNWLLNPWTTFDSQHFFSIATVGYSAQTTPFFPLYPLLLRPFGPDVVRMALAGVIISNLAFLGALWLFWNVTRQIYGAATARRAVWLLAFFPAGAFGMAVYTDSLFMLFGLGAWWFARRNQWVLTAVLAVLAALTRNYGPFLTIALFFEWRRSVSLEKDSRISQSAHRTDSFLAKLSPFLAIIAPFLTFLGVQFYVARVGGALASISSQSAYMRAPNFPLVPLWRDFVDILSGAQLNIVTILNLGGAILAIYLMCRHYKRAPRADLALLGGVLLVHFTLARTIPPYTIATLRYLLGLWPFSQLLALEFEKIATNRLRIVALCAIYGLLCAVHSYLFGLKSFLG